MAYDETLATRLRDLFVSDPNVIEKRMFGGVAFMRRGHMCVGVVKNDLLARVGKDQHDDALKQPFARVMDFTGKPMRGFVYVAQEGLIDDGALDDWVARCRAFTDTLPPK